MSMETPRSPLSTEGIDDFDASFEKVFIEQHITVGEHDIAFHRFEPSEKTEDKPIVYVGGFATSADMYPELKEHARNGREVIFVNPIRGIALGTEELSEQLRHFGIAETIQHKGFELLLLLDALGVHQMQLVGHSQGAAVGALVAALRPGLVDTLVLTNPAGMHGDDSWLGIVGRTARAQVRQVGYNVARNSPNFYTDPDGQQFNENEASRRTSAWKRAQENDGPRRDMLWRLKHEIGGVASTNILPLLQHIKERNTHLEADYQTRVHLLTSNQDDIFAAGAIERELGYVENPMDTALNEQVFARYIDEHSMYVNKYATHDAPIFESAGAIGAILANKV